MNEILNNLRKHILMILFAYFQFIGMLDVPRPTSRVEIVAAMRRIRVRKISECE